MKRLPGYYDSRTSRFESAVFISLAVVGAASITFSVSNALSFAQEQDRIIAALSAPVALNPRLAISRNNHSMTNAMDSQKMPSGGPRALRSSDASIATPFNFSPICVSPSWCSQPKGSIDLRMRTELEFSPEPGGASDASPSLKRAKPQKESPCGFML